MGEGIEGVNQVKFFKGCLPQILLGPFLNTLTHMKHQARNELSSLSGYTNIL